MQKRHFYFFLSLVLVGVFCAGTYVLAADSGNVVKLKNPIADGSIQQILGRIVNRGFAILGSITFLVFVYGGFLWLTSGGNSDKVSKGTSVMTWAVVGIFIIFASYAILNTVIGGLTGQSSSSNNSGTLQVSQSGVCYCQPKSGTEPIAVNGISSKEDCDQLSDQIETAMANGQSSYSHGGLELVNGCLLSQ